jgi:hypothetical protein
MLVSNLSLAPLQSASLCICACILPSSICLFSFSPFCLFCSFALYVYLIVLPYVCLSVCLSISIKLMPLWRIIFFKITYDLVTSSFTLLDLSSETERLVVIDNLWKKTNQVCQVKLSSSSCHWSIFPTIYILLLLLFTLSSENLTLFKQQLNDEIQKSCLNIFHKHFSKH